MSLTDITIDHLWSSLKDDAIVQACTAEHNPQARVFILEIVGVRCKAKN